MSCLVYKMSENCKDYNQSLIKAHRNALNCQQPKDISFSVTERVKNRISTFQKLDQRIFTCFYLN